METNLTRETLQRLAERGMAAHTRMNRAKEVLTAVRKAESEATTEFYDAERELDRTNRYIKAAGFHDTGHLRTELEKPSE